MTGGEDEPGGTRRAGGGRINGTPISGARLLVDPEAALRAALLREAAAFPRAPAPVLRVVRLGREARAARARRGGSVAVSVAVCLVLGVLTGVAWPGWMKGRDTGGGSRVTPLHAVEPSVAAVEESGAAPGTVLVRPGETIRPGPGIEVRLGAGEDANYSVEQTDGNSTRCTKCVAGESVTLAFCTKSGLISGAFRTTEPPRRIVVRYGAESHRATVVRLRGAYRGWGIFYALAIPLKGPSPMEVSVYGAGAKPLIQQEQLVPGTGEIP
ncbi:hypothetical protein ABT354_03545 [Streptomyces sp. NPDC000594]|uniref:hypothetical protein n=1 Tax=Streptomyces sp. NPDC000594 TaxID=3154261 RepID=UPI003321FD75